MAKQEKKIYRQQIDILMIQATSLSHFGMARTAPVTGDDRQVIDDLFLLTENLLSMFVILMLNRLMQVTNTQKLL